MKTARTMNSSRKDPTDSQLNIGSTDDGVGIKILSWNINDMSHSTLDSKHKLSEFTDAIGRCDVFCLQETKENVKIPNFRCFNSIRPDSRSGGVCIGVRQEIADHSKQLKDQRLGDDIVCVKIRKNLLGYDLLIVNVYDSPENSSYKRRKTKDGIIDNTLENLEEFISNQENGSRIITVGDFNARTGKLNYSAAHTDQAIYDDLSSGKFSSCSSPAETNRCSRDNVLNDRGKRLIEFLTACNMKILNGATVGDIGGDFTCLRYNGSSVVDYAIASHSLTRHVNSMEVLRLSALSDHRPLLCSLLCSINTVRCPAAKAPDFEDQPKKYKWDPERSKDTFIDAQTDEIMARCESMCTKTCTTPDDAYQLNEELTNILTSIADTALSTKSPRRPRSKKNRMTAKNPWFDYDCIIARRLLNKATVKYNDDPTVETYRTNFFSKNKSYRKILSNKKSEYLSKLNRDIEEGNNICWDKFQKLKRQTTSSEAGSQLDCYNMVNFYKFFKDLYSAKPLPSHKTI